MGEITWWPLYDNFTILSSHETFIILTVEYIATRFNENTRKNICLIIIYKFSTFIIAFEPNTNVCPSMIIGDSNIDMLDQNLTQPN